MDLFGTAKLVWNRWNRRTDKCPNSILRCTLMPVDQAYFLVWSSQFVPQKIAGCAS